MMAKTKPYIAPKQKKLALPRGTLLYLFLVPTFLSVVFALFQTNIKAFLLNIVSFFLYFVVLKLAKKGFEQEHLYHEEDFTKAPKIAFKTYAGYLLGVATFFAAYVAGGDVVGEDAFVKSAFLATISVVGYYLFYGFDPKKDKLDNLGDLSASFALESIKEAKEKIANISSDMQNIKDVDLRQKLRVAVEKAKQIVKTLQKDPKDIRAARKFLIVYIDGIAKVTDSYTDMDESDIDTITKQKLSVLLDDIQKKFDHEQKRLKNNNQFDLDVHIDVLKEQINN